MAQSPSFQFYAADFVLGTQGMSAAARGCYISMLASSWAKGPIQDSPYAIASAMCLTPFDPPFEGLWREIAPKWTLTADGWINARLEATRRAQEEYRKEQSERGKKSAAVKAHQRNAQPEVNRGSTSVATVAQPALQPALQPEGQPEGQPDPQPEGNSSVFGLRSSSLTSGEVQTRGTVQADPEKPVQSARAVPSLREFDDYRQHLKAAAYAYLSEHPEGDDAGMAKAIRTAAAALHLYDFTGKKINSIVYEVRGYLASQLASEVSA